MEQLFIWDTYTYKCYQKFDFSLTIIYSGKKKLNVPIKRPYQIYMEIYNIKWMSLLNDNKNEKKKFWPLNNNSKTLSGGTCFLHS